MSPTNRQLEIAEARAALERLQTERLRQLIQLASSANAFYRAKLGGAGELPESAATPGELLQHLPFTTKQELEADQAAHPPYGTCLTFPFARYTRIHRTSGTSGRPLWWLDTPESWSWCAELWEEVYRGAGATAADRVFFPFSFGPYLGFWAAFDGAARLGCLAIPAGGMTSASRARAIVETGATIVTATPTYALHLAEAAAAERIDLAATAVRLVIVAGEPGGSVPAVRDRIEKAFGARVIDHCGMTETGPTGFECLENPSGMHLIETAHVAEVVDPRTGRPAEAAGGGVLEGELVLTTLGRLASPVIRYRTGDLVRLSRTGCACRRPFARLEGGILGRSDDLVYIRGNNLYPSALEAIIRAFPGVAEYRVRAVSKEELAALEVEVEPAPGSDSAAQTLRDGVASAIEKAFLFRADVRVVPMGSLPRFELKGQRFHKETR